MATRSANKEKELEATPQVALVVNGYVHSLQPTAGKLFRTIKQTNRPNMAQEQKGRTCG